MPKVGKKGYICALDIGSSKVVCLIAQSVPVEGQIDVLGVGYQQAQGIKKGMITDVETAAQCIQSAVLKAEKEAQLHVSSKASGFGRSGDCSASAFVLYCG